MHAPLLLVLSLFGSAQADAQVEADVVLSNATLYDGSGKPGVIGSVAIKGDRIVAVGAFAVPAKARVLDCTGLILSPGFIDLHTHSDNALQDTKTAPNLNYLRQGVTTVVTGNCGSGPVDVGAYFKKMERVGIGSNVIHQVPHNSVRAKVMGNQNRAPSDDELRLMEDLVDRGMKDGAWGLATGLIYNPGAYSKTDELISLARVAAKHGGFYASHIRNEGVEVMVAIEEVLTIARKAGLRVHISHIKVSGRRAWGKSGDVIARIRRAREEGVEITADQYPYIASSTSLSAVVIPSRFREGSRKDLLARIDDPEFGPKIRKAIGEMVSGRDRGASIKIASFPKNRAWQGKSLADIAKSEKKEVTDLVIEIERKGGAQIVAFGMNEEDVRLFMKEPFVATASDGGAMIPGDTVPHPRNYGTFPRKIGRYAIDEQAVSLEQALRSSSGLPADILKLNDRGYLKVGYIADLVVFDPKTFRDTATFDRPHQYATGVRHLFVNGRHVIAAGKVIETKAGKVLRHSATR